MKIKLSTGKLNIRNQGKMSGVFGERGVEKISCQSAFHGDSITGCNRSGSSKSMRVDERSRKGPVGGVGVWAYHGGGHVEPFSTLGVSPGASLQEIKKAYRRLALKYHPDVCNGDDCAEKFQQVNKAYEVVLNSDSLSGNMLYDLSDDCPEGFMGVGNDSWEDWEEWMGWEGAGIRDYSSHVNMYSF